MCRAPGKQGVLARVRRTNGDIMAADGPSHVRNRRHSRRQQAFFQTPIAACPSSIPKTLWFFSAITSIADPARKDVVDYVRNLPEQTPAKVVRLRGNHEDAWLSVVERGWDEFVLPAGNGCLAAFRSFVGGEIPLKGNLRRPMSS